MASCKMIVSQRLPPDWPKDKIPEDPSDFSVEVECGKAASWTFHDDPEPSVCETCFAKMIFDDPELASDYRYGKDKTVTPAEVLVSVRERLEQYAKEGLVNADPAFEVSIAGNRITCRQVK